MTEYPYISFIGAGNLAWHLAPAFDNVGYAVREVYSRSSKNAKALVNRLYQAHVKGDLDFSSSKSRIFVIAVPDDQIAEVAREIILPEEAILLHTSGAKSIDILKFAACDHIGVFYPLQTFSKGKKVDFSQLPIFVEANNKSTEQILLSLARSMSKNVNSISSETRKTLHVAAVFACNFVNHFLAIAEDLLKEEKLNFSVLHPLIVETIQKSLSIGPDNAQTGPARRHDLQTLDEHMDFLKGNNDLSDIYRMISQHILDRYSEND